MTTQEWLDLYRMAYEHGLTMLRRKKPYVEIRPFGFVPGSDVYIMTTEQAKAFLRENMDETQYD